MVPPAVSASVICVSDFKAVPPEAKKAPSWTAAGLFGLNAIEYWRKRLLHVHFKQFPAAVGGKVEGIGRTDV